MHTSFLSFIEPNPSSIEILYLTFIKIARLHLRSDKNAATSKSCVCPKTVNIHLFTTKEDILLLPDIG